MNSTLTQLFLKETEFLGENDFYKLKIVNNSRRGRNKRRGHDILRNTAIDARSLFGPTD